MRPGGYVAGAVDDERLAAGAELTADRVELRERSVFVRAALNEQRRGRDRGQERRNVPRAKGGIEPRAVPAPEGAVDVGVVTREARAKIGLAVCDAAAAIDLTDRSSTNTCGAISTRARAVTWRAPTAMIAMEAPSL